MDNTPIDHMDIRPDSHNPFELAIVLGKALKEDPRLVRMEAARRAYEENAEVKTLVTEYEVQQKAMENIASEANFDPHMLEMIQDRVDALYRQITEHPTYVELNAAQGAVNDFMNAINNTIMFAITGEMPSNCTHDCSTCGGCH